MFTPSDPTIQLRPIQPDDHDFLYRVYASTRYEELAPVGWPDAVRDAFLLSQFNAQHTYYQATYSGAQYDILIRAGQPIGRLYVERRPDELHILDIALLPDFRNQGIGSGLLRDLIAEARIAALPVGIFVEQNNPARRLYARLGFRAIADHGIYHQLEWRADHADAR